MHPLDSVVHRSKQIFRSCSLLRVTYHTYCYGCDDKHTTVLPSIPPPPDYWKIPPVQLYWKSTKISNSTSRLTHQKFPRTTLPCPPVAVYSITHGSLNMTLQTNHVWSHSLSVILLCLISFRVPTLYLASWVNFHFSYSLTHVF